MDAKKKAVDPAVVALVLTFLLLPPLAPIALIFFLIYKRSKQEAPAQDKTEQDSFGEKLIRRMKEEEIQEQPYKSKPHGHAPVAYSYDNCAKEKRLEQLKVLKDAGLLDDAEYHQRRQAILDLG
ncbi:MAG: SHOCT domain-containing protein [Oscillospiraceae bacterium]|nr:SHOCT domain-containing protein [Oscillospiraceae bacterium]